MNRDQIRQLAMETAEEAILKAAEHWVPWPPMEWDDQDAVRSEMRRIAGQVARGGVL